MNEPTPKPKESLALQRFEVICYIKNLQQQGVALAQCLRLACSRPWPEPDGPYYSHRTMENWWYDYARSGYNGLAGKTTRVDAGKSRVLDEETGLWIIDKIKENPRTPLRVLYRHWQQHGHELPSMTSVYRFLKSHGYDRRSLKSGRLETGPQKAFEAPAPNDLWMADFACGPCLRTPEGKSLTTHLCVLVDDHSRLIAFGAYYLREDTASLLHALKEAVLRHGIPHKLYTDQGKPFVNHHVRIVCANLGVRLLHAKPYHAWSKGKVERLIRTIQSDFEQTLRLEGSHLRSIEELNQAFSRWVASVYHLRTHGSTKETPLARFNRAGYPLRSVEDPSGIDALFYTRTERMVRKDGTVTLEKSLFECDLSLRGLKVELRYDPVLMDRVEVWHKGRSYGVAGKANLHLNSQTYNGGNNYAR